MIPLLNFINYIEKTDFLNVCISEQYSVTFLRYYVTSISLNIWLKQLPNSFTLLCLCSVFDEVNWIIYVICRGCMLEKIFLLWENILQDVHGIFARSYELFYRVLKMTKHHFEDSKFNAQINNNKKKIVCWTL